MRTLRAYFKLSLFVSATGCLYGGWWLTHFFVPNKVYWRQLLFRAWTGSFVRISGMRIDVIGTPPKPPFFLVCNHLSYTDIPALRQVVDGVFVAKAEVAGWPVAGRIVRDIGTIFINRGNRRDIPRAGEKVMERLADGEGVIVFPEGTSGRGDSVMSFNSSFLEFAARSSVPVSYAVITYRTPADELPASTAVCWWDDTTFFQHLLRLFELRSYEATLIFGDEPLVATDRKLLSKELHRHIADRFIPVL
jgi:1-acyl-sn-glycerol-3-phosphate acyltransferase